MALKTKIVFDVTPEFRSRWLRLCEREHLTQAEMFRQLVAKEDSEMTEKLCESCLQDGTRTPATTHSTNPDWSGYDLCEECAAEYDSRRPTATEGMTDAAKMISAYRWETIVHYMDDDIREQVHRELAPCSNEEFLARYLELHREKYGEDYQIN